MRGPVDMVNEQVRASRSAQPTIDLYIYRRPRRARALITYTQIKTKLGSDTICARGYAKYIFHFPGGSPAPRVVACIVDRLKPNRVRVVGSRTTSALEDTP